MKERTRKASVDARAHYSYGPAREMLSFSETFVPTVEKLCQRTVRIAVPRLGSLVC